ncbi:MAG: hypothetical protein ACRDL3_04045 [Solirubrobacterales bacterium]
MSGFRRSFLGYRRSEVDAELAARDAAMAATEGALEKSRAKVEELEGVAGRLSEEVVQRNRELKALREELAELRESEEEGMQSLAALGRQLEEIRRQAQGQATQIRLRALRDAAEMVERVSEMAKRPGTAGGRVMDALDGAIQRTSGAEREEYGERIVARGNGGASANGLFQGRVHMDVGPLSDFSQLVRLEDAAGSIGATSEISIRRFSQGRAEMEMELGEPVELLRELEERCDLEFRVRSRKGDRVVLDVEDDEE